MTSYFRLTLLTLCIGACGGCSSDRDSDLFQDETTTASGNDGAGTTSGSGATSAGGTTTGGGGSSSTSTTGASTTSISSTIGVQAATSAGTVASTSGSSTATSSSSTSSSSSSSTSASTNTATTGSQPITVTIDLPEDDDCIEAQCPEEAPYLVGCEIAFSESTDPDACVVDEGDGQIFIKSGDSCGGSNVSEGSISCSSAEPESLDAVLTHCLVENKPDLVILDNRCDCKTPAGTPGC